MQLSDKQTKCFDDIMRWYKSGSPVYVLAGYAGTGKSTLAAKIEAEIGTANVAYCAYTGKAANVLREKGCANVCTLHGWLYTVHEKSQRKLTELKEYLATLSDPADVTAVKAEIAELNELLKEPGFTLNTLSELRHFDLVIVDEYSMLDDQIIEDLYKLAKKVLFLGDPYQLPPVKGECSLKPNHFLDEIHRQALDSGIILMSKTVREGGNINLGDHGDFKYLTRRQASQDLFLNADQLIVGRNNTRRAMNKWYRDKLGYADKWPMAGEKVICLKNNHAACLFNGLIGTVASDSVYSGLYYYLDVEGVGEHKVYADDVLGNEQSYDYRNKAHKELERFTFAYAITCHKSQGSEFDNLVVINEPVGRGEERRRWLYTAITRAKKQCTLIQGG